MSTVLDLLNKTTDPQTLRDTVVLDTTKVTPPKPSVAEVYDENLEFEQLERLFRVVATIPDAQYWLGRVTKQHDAEIAGLEAHRDTLQNALRTDGLDRFDAQRLQKALENVDQLITDEKERKRIAVAKAEFSLRCSRENEPQRERYLELQKKRAEVAKVRQVASAALARQPAGAMYGRETNSRRSSKR
jgi:hypothetical protein